MWRFRTSHPKICLSDSRSLWAKGNFNFRLKRNSCSFLYLHRRVWIRGLADNRRSELTSFGLSIRQGKPLFTKLWRLFYHLKRCMTSSLAQDTLYNSTSLFISEPLVYVGLLTLSCMWGSCEHEIQLYFLLSICILLIWLRGQLKEPEKGKGNFLLHIR